ncbi:MAG TPA: prephenate dehydratase [Solirubrobacteraceae bacterium]|jgi:prephenate dehydratase|nr:prephenate dehydratase [Solirubrobacteraceae bacterium]
MHAESAVQRPRVGYLGPAGTFTEEALRHSARAGELQEVALPGIYDTVLALRRGEVEWAVVPIENSLEGSVTVTLDLLADQLGDLEIVGEALIAVRHALIAAEPLALSEIDTVITHPQVPGQCTRLLRGELAHARVLPASSTAEAVRLVADGHEPGAAAIGTRLAADIYRGTVVREGVQDRDDNVTRFVWLGRADRSPAQPPPLRGGEQEGGPGDGGGPGWKTSVVFWGAGADSPGWLVRCLDQFARRAINLTKIESRPQRARLGHYVFFVDLQGGMGDPVVAEALAGVRAVCEEARILGSYRAVVDP